MRNHKLKEASKEALQFGIFTLIMLLLLNAVIGVPNLIGLLIGMVIGKFILFYVNKSSEFVSFLSIFRGGK